MTLLIASDLHGSARYARVLQELFNQHQASRLLLLGDLLYHGPRNPLPEEYSPPEVIEILNSMREKILAVRGNCEAEVDQMVLQFPVMAEYAVIFEQETTVYATHGHHIGQEWPPLAQGDVLLSGHTHIGKEEFANGIVRLNPGSIALPKDGNHSYMLLRQGVFSRYNLQGKLLGQWPPVKQ